MKKTVSLLIGVHTCLNLKCEFEGLILGGGYDPSR